MTQSRSPYGSINGQEGLDAILMASAFAECAVLLQGDGIFQVLRHQDPSAIEFKDYSVTYEALADYGVTEIYCLSDELDERCLITSDLLIEVTPLNLAEAQELIQSFDVILDF